MLRKLDKSQKIVKIPKIKYLKFGEIEYGVSDLKDCILDDDGFCMGFI